MQYIKDRDYLNSAVIILGYYHYNKIRYNDYLKDFMKFEFLKKKALKTINNFGGVLYRGVDSRSVAIGGDLPDILDPKFDITSWTTDYYTAQAFASKNGIILIEHDLSNVIFYMDHFMEFVKNNLYKHLDYDYQLIVEGYVSESEVICKSKPFKLINGSSYKVNENLDNMIRF